MAKKVQQISIDDFLRDNLQATLREELGKRQIEKVEMPSSFSTALNPMMPLRPYQKEAFQYFFSYWDNDFEGKAPQSQLLFHMATGSGKTLIMGGIILYLYEQGYRNFLFFVNSGNVIEKTKDNFFNTASSKYLFNQSITINNKRVEIKQVDNFQDSDPDAINFCLQTIQGLHGDLNTPKENGVTYDDFKNIKVVLIADEAHHINTATKNSTTKPGQLSLFSDDELEDMEPSDDWETTVMRIFRANPANVLLEFTATEDFANANIADKYKDKVIFDYPLRKFREDGYSKDIAVLQSDLQPIDRAIQAVIMSQFRRKLGNQIRQDIKPVVMLKSKTIKANKEFFDEFVETIKHLNVDTLTRIKANTKDGVLDAFKYFEAQKITLENLLLEIQEDFKENNLLLVDGSSISAEKQQYLNSLEDKDNEFRAVFAVDMLNEGWDVLNLFDIVRLYDTRDARSGTVGATTNSEAQLIGRGARYLPFTDKPNENSQPKPYSETEEIFDLTESSGAGDPLQEYGTPKPRSEYATKRKFDEDLNNPLRHLETLSYHSAHNPRYLQELNSALAQTGIIDSQNATVVEKLKESFKKTRLYTDGYVFANEQEVYLINENLTNIGENILTHNYPVKISTGETITSKIFSKATAADTANVRSRKFKLKDFGKHVLRAAINKFDGLKFQELHEIFPNLESIKQFIESPDYLANISVTVYGREDILDNLTQKDKLFIVVEVLNEIEPKLARGGIGTRGSKKFMPKQVRDVFRDHVYKVSHGANKEDGVSMKETTNTFLRYDLSTADWYGYEDNFGTEEEKYLIRYIESIEKKLREKYDEVYLLRNYKDLKIYAFKDGAATEPDFVLFLRKKGTESEYDNIQIFIEPKGAHLRKNDAWKEEFEKSIHDEAILTFNTANDQFEVWGMPFYTHSYESDFSQEMTTKFM